MDGVSEHSGFPNPATDSNIVALDIARLLVKHPSSTFFMQISGNAWEDSGIFNGDIAIIDRALDPKKTDLIIWWEGDSFIIAKFSKLPKDASLWGVVTAVVHRFRP